MNITHCTASALSLQFTFEGAVRIRDEAALIFEFVLRSHDSYNSGDATSHIDRWFSGRRLEPSCLYPAAGSGQEEDQALSQPVWASTWIWDMGWGFHYMRMQLLAFAGLNKHDAKVMRYPAGCWPYDQRVTLH